MKDELNKEQKEAVCFGSGPLLVLAGAGSGKTKVLTHRVFELIQENSVDPKKIVLLTFTNKAAGEMKKRIESMGAKTTEIGFAGTFHSFGVKTLREFAESLGLSKNFVIFDDDDTDKLIKSIFKEENLEGKDIKPAVYKSVISKMKNDLMNYESIESSPNYFYQQVAKIWKKYQARLKSNHALDFDDLLSKTVEVFKNEDVKKIIQERYEWILVDEYQDTNKAQFEITRILAEKSRNIMAVGDASQAIYSFRGADFRNISLLESSFPELKTVSLPKNYRSTQHILDSAYGVIKNNTSHPTIKLEATKIEGEKIGLIEAGDEREEARKIVEMCRLAAETDQEVAVLYRTNAQSRSIEDELIKRDIAYRLVGGVRFYNRAEVKDLIAYLRVINNPSEEVSRSRLEKLGKRKLAIFENWLSEATDLETKNPGEVLKEVVETVRFLDKYDERDEENVERIENINELLAVASQYKDIESFLDGTALAEAEVRQSRSEARISLMTVHAAKGLEFDVVFLIGLEEGLFPHTRAIMSGDKQDTEEERRLMYVAMTRARSNLYLSFARSRMVYGGRMTTIPSRFLGEIPEENIQKTQKIENSTPTASQLGGQAKNQNIEDNWNGKRRIVQDWEIEEVTKSDFADIDNW